tara:strand:- start:618 stop:788 length:171 start_codon:yes stop_codon:yes gene_type:complete
VARFYIFFGGGGGGFLIVGTCPLGFGSPLPGLFLGVPCGALGLLGLFCLAIDMIFI